MKTRKPSASAALTAAVVTAHVAAMAAVANEAAAIEICQPPTDGAAAPCPQPETKLAHLEPSRRAVVQPAAVPPESPPTPNVGRRLDELGPLSVGPMFQPRFGH
jgi:hypothetical protein